MSFQLFQGLSYRKRIVFWVIVSYALLLLMSYGFPITGDDWYFYPQKGTKLSLGEEFSRAVDISLHHYQTTNGRLLGNFFVSFLVRKIFRELVRCGLILLIIVYTFRLSGNRSFASYLMCFALLIAMPASVVSQTYTWAAGFFNYVPPTLLVLLYFNYAKRIFCDDLCRTTVFRIVLLFLLGLSMQFFIENISLGMCVLSAAVFVTDWIRRKRMDLTLAAHFLGVVIGCVIMFLAPGYGNIGQEGYRDVPSGFAELLRLAEKNFTQLSTYLITDNALVVLPLCISGVLVCARSLSETSGKRWISKACMLYFAAFPLLSHGIHFVGRYLFVIDLLIDLGLFAAIVFSAYYCICDNNARFVLYFAAGTFLVFIAPLFFVTPVGSRNAFFFNAFLILITMTLFRQATRDWNGVKQIAPALVLVSCLLLFGNLWIHLKNGSVEQLRVQILEEAMERREQVITLPGYPYPSYIHGAASVNALGCHYFYDTQGDITFKFISYRDWIIRE